jgi:S1-C subfamily serine protease
MGIGVAVAAPLAGISLAGDDSEVHNEHKGTVRVVVVDDDGTRHEEVFEFDDDHRRPFLGVRLDEAHGGGALIEKVIEDTGAERAGLQQGDVIVSVDGEEIETPWDLTRHLLRSEPGALVELEVIRDGDRQSFTAELGERDDGFRAFAHGFDAEAFGELMEGLGERLEDLEFDFEGFDADAFEDRMERLHERLEDMDFDFDFDFDLGDADFRHHRMLLRHDRPKLGVELVDVTHELREHLGGSRGEGVLVARLIPDMPAETAGVLVGDLIVAADGETIDSSGDLRRALRDKDGETIDLEVIREGQPMNLRVFIPEAERGDTREEHLPEARPVVAPSQRT